MTRLRLLLKIGTDIAFDAESRAYFCVNAPLYGKGERKYAQNKRDVVDHTLSNDIWICLYTCTHDLWGGRGKSCHADFFAQHDLPSNFFAYSVGEKDILSAEQERTLSNFDFGNSGDDADKSALESGSFPD